MATRLIRQGETLSKIAQEEGVTISSIQQANPNIQNPDLIFAGTEITLPQVEDKTPQEDPEAPVIPVDEETIPIDTGDVDMPESTAQEELEDFDASLQGQVEREREALNKRIEAELEAIRKKQEEAQERIDEITKTQEGVITGPVQEALTPFRQQLEAAERERLKVNENFEKNQALINELGGLLTESSSLIKKLNSQRIPGLGGLQQSQRSINRLGDVEARVGVIESVMSARNNQIGQAFNMIDRTKNAITADRKDTLNYYQTILDFEQNKKDEQGQKLLNLTEDEKKFVDFQIDLATSDLEKAEASAEYIKELMTDPDTAQFIADAGVSLTDSVEEINEKMAEQSRAVEIRDFKNEMTAEGFTHVPFPGDRTDLQEFEVGGKTLYFEAPVKATDTPEESTTDISTETNPGTADIMRQAGLNISDTTARVIDGITSLDSLPEGSLTERDRKTQAQDELRQYGFYEENPPEWFDRIMKEAMGVSNLRDVILQDMWDQAREAVGTTGTPTTNSSNDRDPT